MFVHIFALPFACICRSVCIERWTPWEREGGRLWERRELKELPTILISCACYNKFSQIWWLKTTEKARCLKSISLNQINVIRSFLVDAHTQSCPTLWDPLDYSLPGSSVHGILQVRILEWIAISSSRGSSWPRDKTCISCVPAFSALLVDFLPLSHGGNPCHHVFAPSESARGKSVCHLFQLLSIPWLVAASF